MPRNFSHLHGNTHAQGNKPNKTSFLKDHVPWNKDKKGLQLSPLSQFKKGVPSGRAVPLFTIRTRKGRKGIRRQHIKTALRWMEYAKWLWIESYGALIPGDVVHHINGVAIDDRLDNLIALPRSEHVIYHNRWGLVPVPKDRFDFYLSRYVPGTTNAVLI